MKLFIILFGVALVAMGGCVTTETASTPAPASPPPTTSAAEAIAAPSPTTTANNSTVWVERERRNPQENNLSVEFR